MTCCRFVDLELAVLGRIRAELRGLARLLLLAYLKIAAAVKGLSIDDIDTGTSSSR